MNEPASTPRWQEIWDADGSYEVVATTIGGRKRFRFVGDILRINSTDFASLIREPHSPVNDVLEIDFDAREIIVEAALSFTTARVRFLGDRITLRGSGAVHLTDPAQDISTPPLPGLAVEGRHDGVTIVARELRVENGIPFPFAFSPRVYEPRRRQLIVVAKRTVDNGKEVASHQMRDWVAGRTYGSKFGSYEDDSVHIVVGDAASASYATIFAESMSWPLRFAGKLQAYFARDPFEESLRTLIRDLARQTQELLAEYPLAAPSKAVERIGMHIENDLDAYGYSRFQIPRDGLEFLAKTIDTGLQQNGPGSRYLNDLESLAIEAHQGAGPDAAKLAIVRQELLLTQEELDVTQADVTAKLNHSAKIAQELEGLAVKLTQARTRLQEKLQKLREQNEDLANIRAVTSIATAAVALVPGIGPAAAAGLSATIGVTGELIYRHNAGNAPNVIQLVQIISANVEYGKDVAEINKSWLEFVKNAEIARDRFRGKLPTPKPGEPAPDPKKLKREALRNLSKAGADVKNRIVALLERLPKHVPSTLVLNELEKEDAELQALLATQQNLIEDADRSVLEIHELKGVVDKLQVEIVALNEQIASLLAMDLKDDQTLARWYQIALLLRRQSLERLFRLGVTLRRSLAYVLGKPPSLPDVALYFPDESLAYAGMRADPASVAHASVSPELLAKRFSRENNQLGIALQALRQAATSAREQLESRRTAADFSQRRLIFSGGPEGSAQQGFLMMLNGAIHRQITQPNQSKVPTILPFPSGPERGFTPYPDAFVDAVVSVELDDPDAMVDKAIEFAIVHPGYGVFYVGDERRLVDFRDKAADEDRTFKFSTITHGHLANNWRDELLKKEPSKQEADRYALLPLETDYLLILRVTGNREGPNFSRVPRIKTLLIDFAVIN